MMILMRHMIYSKESYFLFLMNPPSRLIIFLIVGKVNLGLLLGHQLLFAGNGALKKNVRIRNVTEYRWHLNFLSKVTRTAREQYYHNLLEFFFVNSKKVWSNINTILGETNKSSSTSIKLMASLLMNLK